MKKRILYHHPESWDIPAPAVGDFPLCLPDHVAVAFGDECRRLHYSEEGVLGRLQAADAISVAPRAMPRLLDLTHGGDMLDTLIRLFVLGCPVDEGKWQSSRGILGSLCEGGILLKEGTCLWALVRLVPFGGRLILFDPPTKGRNCEPKDDHVHGMGRASMELLYATVREPLGRVLDLGCGCGIQGMLAAQHANEVICTDVNQRALDATRISLAINGIKNVQVRAGSLFEPVEGETFDLILANPPFAISPGRRYMFRDGGMQSDQFVQTLATSAVRHLRPDGLCQMTAQWADYETSPGNDRVRSWFSGKPVDVWLFCQRRQSAAAYAESWISETERHEMADYVQRWQEWISYFQQEGITSVSTGMLMIRRRDAGEENWFSLTEDIRAMTPDSWRDIRSGFSARDVANQVSVRDFSEARLRLSERTEFVQTLSMRPDGVEMRTVMIRLRDGLPYEGLLDPVIFRYLMLFQTPSTITASLSGFAKSEGIAVEQFEAVMMPMMKNFFERGYVVVV